MNCMPVAVLALGLLASAAPALAIPAEGPAAVVDGLYRAHFAKDQVFDDTREQERARFAAPLLALLEADARASAAASEIVGLDFDPLTSSQEQVDGYSVAPAQVSGDEARVPVEIRLGAERHGLQVRLVRAGGRWQVSDIEYEEGTLVSLLEQLAASRTTP